MQVSAEAVAKTQNGQIAGSRSDSEPNASSSDNAAADDEDGKASKYARLLILSLEVAP
jgi:hypothetical protein